MREDGVVDWRAIDPSGKSFVVVSADRIDRAARAITRSLGLSTSVQDYLDTPDGPVFLEANPQGSWLFLSDAEDLIVPALAQHLRSTVSETPGYWPPLGKRVLYDFLTNKRAPSQDGAVPPTFAPALWIDEIAELPECVDVARRANDDAVGAAKSAEDKASRLVQVALALMTVTLALGAFQVTFALDRSWVWLWSLIPIAFALSCLSLAAFEALQIDRVGFYRTAKPADLAELASHSSNAAIVAAEEDGRLLARWTSNNKHTDLMQARAWFSRGLITLIAAALLAASLRAGSDAYAAPTKPTTPSTIATAPSK